MKLLCTMNVVLPLLVGLGRAMPADVVSNVVVNSIGGTPEKSLHVSSHHGLGNLSYSDHDHDHDRDREASVLPRAGSSLWSRLVRREHGYRGGNWIDNTARWKTRNTWLHYNAYAGEIRLAVPQRVADGKTGPCTVRGDWIVNYTCECDVRVRPFFSIMSFKDVLCNANMTIIPDDEDLPNPPTGIEVVWNGDYVRHSDPVVDVHPWGTNCYGEGNACEGYFVTDKHY
ncbi:MAG: hypothetical protein M1833_006392 [Piccolia ochrophora]|nr:MAG: hypothetical protein M1833_006392 [Piccolia ochrophora]